MTTSAPTIGHESGAAVEAAANRTLAALVAAALGLVIVFASGFAPSDAVHNAAHDTRHSFAFPGH